MMRFTAKEKRNYEDNPVVCPICKSTSVSVRDHGTHVDHTAVMFLHCLECKAEWKSSFKETKVELIWKSKEKA